MSGANHRFEDEGRKAWRKVLNQARRRQAKANQATLDQETVVVECTPIVVRVDKGAVLLRHESTGTEAWVPKSLLSDPSALQEDCMADVELSRWKADQLGWA